MVLYHQPALGHRETTCHLCLRETALTYEHIPPKKAFNDCRKLWERFNPRTKGIGRDGQPKGPAQTRHEIWQGGFYVRTLCKACKNATGGTSARAYVQFVKALAEAPRLFEPDGKQPWCASLGMRSSSHGRSR